MPIILASSSPRRSRILKEAGFDFHILRIDVDEIFPADMPAAEVPLFLARCKMKEAKLKSLPDDIIITADTVVILQNRIIGKPEDREDAFKILKKLSGKKHTVITGICIAKNKKKIEFDVATAVHFETMSDDEINYYLDHYAPYDKAGAYAIQEWIGMNKIMKIEGDYFNVVGFPMSRIYPVLISLIKAKK